MGTGLWKKRPAEAAAATTQLREPSAGFLTGQRTLCGGECRLYRAVRQAVPAVDAAIGKIIRLTGGVEVHCEEPAAERALAQFLRTVNVGRGQVGINAFLDMYLDSMLTCGQGIGEIVLSQGHDDIAALLCGRVEDIQIQEGRSPLEFLICGYGENGVPQPLPCQELLLFTPYNPEAENPYGVSMLRGMPFLTELLGKIYTAMGTNWERMGNVRFAVVYKPQSGELDAGMAKERSRQIASEWSRAMESSKSGRVRDFVAIGDVDIKVIGADNQILDSEVPVRQILEQLIAKTGIPPFMLGLSWSSTERMSTQQADILTSELTAIRRGLTPVVEKICRLWLRLHGFYGDFTVDWNDINLQDELEEAKAEWYRQQARQIQLNNERTEREQGHREAESAL